MSADISASFKYPKYITFPTSKCFRSRFLLETCPHETAFDLNWRVCPQLHFFYAAQPSSISISKRMAWTIRSSVEGSGLNDPSESNTSSGTRLVKAIQTLQIKLNTRLQQLKKGLPMKLLFFLVGFYCATAFATVIGQTGDWDILSAGLALIIVEAIGALMYKASFPMVNKIRNLITMFNYWKTGLSLGLFLDAFKYEIDDIFGLSNPFDFEIDVFPMFL